VVGDFIGYAATYVGAALISGAVVHHPMDPTRFTMIAIIGAVVFALATAFTEFVINRQRATTRAVVLMVLTSLALSFGIGSLSGGLQHFADVPTRAAVLIPAGLVLAFIAYVLRYHAARWRSIIRPTGLALLAGTALVFIVLHQIAGGMSSGHGGGHGHGPAADPKPARQPSGPTAEQPAGEQPAEGGPAASAAPQQPGTSPPARQNPPGNSGPADDGHNHSHN
jgi:hypothetical protein